MSGFLLTADGKFSLSPEGKFRIGEADDPCCCPPPTSPGGCSFCGETGAAAIYFDNPNLTFGGFSPSRTDATIDFHWRDTDPEPPAPNIPYDNFSVFWSGSFIVKGTGPITFYVTSQQGVRFHTAGVLRIDEWTPDHSSTEHTYTTVPSYSPGTILSFELHFRSTTGDGIIKLEWSQTGVTREVVPENCMWTGNANGINAGLATETYTTLDLTGTPTAGTVTGIDFSGTAATVYSRRYTGYILAPIEISTTATFINGYRVVPNDTVVTFDLTATDGARLWIDDELLVDQWIDRASTVDTFSKTLRGGRYYEFRLEHYSRVGPDTLKLEWLYNGRSKIVVPAANYARSEVYPSPGQYTATIAGAGLCSGCFETGSVTAGTMGGQNITGGAINGTFCLTARPDNRCIYQYREVVASTVTHTLHMTQTTCAGTPTSTNDGLLMEVARTQTGLASFRALAGAATLFATGSVVWLDCNESKTFAASTTGSATCLATNRHRYYGGTVTLTPGTCE